MKELNDKKISGLKATDRREEHKDGHWPLWLVVQPTGTKSFQWRGRVEGRDRRKALGRYWDGHSGVRLKEARDLALAIRAAGGPEGDTSGQKTETRPVLTVADCFQDYMKRDGSQKKSASEKWRMWRQDIEPAIGQMEPAAVTRFDVATIIENRFDRLIDAGMTGVSANRLHSHLLRLFNWGLKSGKWGLLHNPMALVEKFANETVRDRTLSVAELRWLQHGLLWMKSDRSNDKSDIFARGFELLLRTLARRSEVFNMEWGWIEGDKLLIPTTKNGDPHLVWLHPSAMRLIGERPAGAKNSDRVFDVCVTAMDKPMKRLRAAMIRLAAEEGEDIERWTLHDLRRTATTHLAGMFDDDDRQLVAPVTLDRLLAHRERGVMKHYNHHDYWREKKLALRLWGDGIDNIFI